MGGFREAGGGEGGVVGGEGGRWFSFGFGLCW